MKQKLAIDLWKVLWANEFLFRDTSDFRQDFLEAWRQKYLAEGGGQSNPLRYIVLLIDYGPSIEIPCSESMVDADLMKHLNSFLNLLRMERGLLEALQFKTIARIDVIEVSS